MVKAGDRIELVDREVECRPDVEHHPVPLEPTAPARCGVGVADCVEARGEQIVLPSASNARLANDAAFVTERARRCWQQKGRIPNFIYVDWFGQGDVMGAVHTLNEVPR